MSSDFPPQLQLRLPPSSTSFKRSFEEFGFDLASPSGDSDGNGGSSSSNGNERNKRPRSASSSRTSDSENSPSEIPHSASASSSSSSSTSSASAFAHATSPLSSTRPTAPSSHGNSLHLGATSSSARPFHDIPTLATPAIQDVEMLSYLSSPSALPPTQSLSSSPPSPIASPQSPPPPPPPPSLLVSNNNNNNNGSSHRVQQDEQRQHLRLSLGRFNTFDTTEIAALRRSHSVSSLAPRLSTSPPILPPLLLSDDQPDLAAAALPFLHAEHRSDATLPQPPLDGDPSNSTNRARSRIDVVRPDAISRNPSTDIDVPPFQRDTHFDSTFQQQPSHRSDRPSLPLRSPAQASPSTIESSPVDWTQPAPTTATPTTDPAMEFTVIRDRLDSALEPLRSGSPLVPELAEPRPVPPPPPLPPVQRQSRTSAPTLPPLRTQLQNAGAWDELSPYRMMFFGPSGSATNAVVQDNNSMQEDRPPVDHNSGSSSARPPVAYWGNAPYPLMPLSVPPSLSTNHRDRESTSHDRTLPSESGHMGNVFSSAQQSLFSSVQQSLGPHHPHTSHFFEEPDLGAHPSSLEEAPSSRPQQLSSESLPRSSLELEGYLSPVEWLPALRRRSAWRLLDSDDEERLSADARRLRLLAERREIARAGMQEMDSLPELSEPRPPWIDIEGERRRPVGSRPPDPPLRSNPAPADRFERGHFWDDGDRMPANAAVAHDTWSRAESRGDLSQRLERLADLDYDPDRLSLSRSNTTTSAFTAFNRLRSRLYHSTSTRFGSSNSLVTENSSESRRRSAHQEWIERMNEERAHTQPGSRPPRSSMSSDISMSDDSRRSGLQPTSTTATAAAGGGSLFERRMFGSIDGLDEPRQSDPFSFESDHVFEESFPPPRRVSSLSRPPALSSSWNDHPVRRPVSPPQPPQSHLGRSTSDVQSYGHDSERYSRFLNYLNDYHDSSFYGPPFEFGPPNAPHAHPRSPEESSAHRAPSRDSQTDWFSRRRHPSARASSQPHATHAGSWSEIAADYVQERSSEGGRSSSVFGPRSSARQTDREASFAELRASFDRNSARANEAQRLSSMSPVSPYLIDVPPMPSPDLSELLENVSHFQQNAPHEERLVSARSVPEMPARLVPRRRSPTPPPPAPPPAPRLPPRPRVERPPPGRTTSFDHIDPEVFAPGPYRNTFQSLIRRRDASPPASRPPTIPPFPFESGTSRDVPPARRYRHSYAETFDSRPEPEPAPPPTRTVAESNEELPHPSFWRPRETGRRPALYVRNDWDHTSSSSEDRHRLPPPPPPPPPANDLHAFLTRHVRLEGARMDRIAEAAAAQLNEASSNASRFNHAIEVLRGDGLSRRQSADRPLGPRSSGEPPRERTSAEWYHPPVRRRVRARRSRPLGDYMRDEDFDESYESLLSLAAAIGEVKPRCTPEDVISKLETATYKDWATTDSDKRCPICLDDYSSSDFVMKAGACSHWLHKDCLHQWLKGANTCPVCRMPVHSSRIRHAPRPRHQRTQVSANSPSTSNNNIANISVNVSSTNDRQDHLAPSPDTTDPQSHNTETSRPFSTRSRNFSGWSGWRYYHP